MILKKPKFWDFKKPNFWDEKLNLFYENVKNISSLKPNAFISLSIFEHGPRTVESSLSLYCTNILLSIF